MNYSLLVLSGISSQPVRRTLARNNALARLNFAAAASPSPIRPVVVYGSSSPAISSALGGDSPAPLADSFTDSIRSALSLAPELEDPPARRPDPSLLVDFVACDGCEQYSRADPPPSLQQRVVHSVAHSVDDVRALSSPGSVLVLAVRSDDTPEYLRHLSRLFSSTPCVVAFEGRPSPRPEEARSRLRSAFPSAASVVDSTQLLPAILGAIAPGEVPATWLLLHRELLRADRLVLSWPEAAALGTRCGVTDPGDLRAALECSPSLILPGACVAPSRSRFLHSLNRTFLPSPNIHPLPSRHRRAASTRLRRSTMVGADILRIFRASIRPAPSLPDASIFAILQRFSCVHPADDSADLFVVRSPRQPASNLPLHARLLRPPSPFSLVDARADGRVHFQFGGRRYSSWMEDPGDLQLHSDEASGEEAAAVRLLLFHISGGER